MLVICVSLTASTKVSCISGVLSKTLEDVSGQEDKDSDLQEKTPAQSSLEQVTPKSQLSVSECDAVLLLL